MPRPTDTIVQELADAARASGRLGIDTEFVGEGRYRPLLCLAQVAVDTPSGGVRIELLDPIEDEFDPTPLAEVLADPEVEIVLHAARQDVALLKRTWSTDVRNVFDTQVAAGFAGLRAQMGYDALLREVLRVKLQKSASFTRWEQRPLSEEQRRYAAEDVQHLLQLAVALQNRLVDLGRLDWAIEECRPLEDVRDSREPTDLFPRLPRVDRLDPGQRAVAFSLLVWREETAAQVDRPPSTVLQDQTLVELAKRRPTSRDRLKQIRGLSEATLHRRGDSLLEAIARGREAEPIPVTIERPPRTDPADPALVVLAETLVRTRAEEEHLAYELLASRSDLQRIITSWRDGREDDGIRTLQGWRGQLVGGDVLDLLEGRASLRVADGRVAVDR
ncbi:HRDC domain-containing protein [Patulibacter brassicae]|uniref:HRDC domain-containing protein n=1 Tax=Patulibacter brassicae TaxID=1705717 RepID=A0ABU4VNV8_9ACTN|nr:HRDC domain-containing protein [Patulibacter brassicae]MDX8153518.1 HRDC domain-containing protein [Patulibacter brassicae]